jgi:hypothetical protein
MRRKTIWVLSGKKIITNFGFASMSDHGHEEAATGS